MEKTAEDNKITLTEHDLKSTDKIEIVPNYKFNLGSSTVDGYVTANVTKSNGYGFTKEPTVVTSTIEGAAGACKACGPVHRPVESRPCRRQSTAERKKTCKKTEKELANTAAYVV